jgi:hypothetical protein
MATVVTEHADRAGTRTREIGPIGTVSRMALGLAALVLPIVFEGLDWWDVLGWVGLTVLATAASRAVLGALGGYAGDGRRGLGAWSAATCFLAALLLGASVAIGIGTPAEGDVVLWGFLGLSMLVAAVRGDAGCEVLAFPNALLRRRDRVGCVIFTPIDAAEARRDPSATASPTRE